MADITDTIIALFIGAILTGALIPVAINLILNANTTSFDAATLALYTIIPIAIIIAVVVIFFKIAQKQ